MGEGGAVNYSLRDLRIFLRLFLLGGCPSAVIQDLSQDSAIEDGGDDVIDDGEKVARLDPRSGNADDAAEEQETHGDGGQLTRRRSAEVRHDLQQLEAREGRWQGGGRNRIRR